MASPPLGVTVNTAHDRSATGSWRSPATRWGIGV